MIRETKPAKKFLVLTTQRSGSTWLISMLDKTGALSAYGELFHRRARAIAKKRLSVDDAFPRFCEVRRQSRAIRPFSLFSYLNGFYQQSGAVGFKLMYSDLWRFPEIWGYIAVRKLPVIHLVRENSLDVFISSSIKSVRGQSHQLANESPLEDITISLDPAQVKRYIKRHRRRVRLARRLLRWFRIRHLEVSYENLCGSEDAFQRATEFLGIPTSAGAPQSNLVRIRQGNHRAVITNYDEVKSALAASCFANMIE